MVSIFPISFAFPKIFKSVHFCGNNKVDKIKHTYLYIYISPQKLKKNMQPHKSQVQPKSTHKSITLVPSYRFIEILLIISNSIIK